MSSARSSLRNRKQFSRLDEAVANLQRVKANLKRLRSLRPQRPPSRGRLVETKPPSPSRDRPPLKPADSFCSGFLMAAGRREAANTCQEPVDLKPSQGTARRLGMDNDWSSLRTHSFQTGPFKTWSGVTFLANPALISTIAQYPVARSQNSSLLTRLRWRLYRLKAGDIPADSKMGDPPAVLEYRPFARKAVITARLHQVAGGQRCIDPAFVGTVTTRWMRSRPIYGITKGVSQQLTCTSISVCPPPFADQTRIVAEVDRHLSIIREVRTEIDINHQRAQHLRQRRWRFFSPRYLLGLLNVFRFDDS